MYALARGVEQNCVKAKEYFELAAAQGYITPYDNLRYLNKWKIEKSPKLAKDSVDDVKEDKRNTGVQQVERAESMEEEKPVLSNIELTNLWNRVEEISAASVQGRPRKGETYQPKKQAMIRFEPEVMEWLKSKGSHYSTRLNSLLLTLKEAETLNADIGPK